MTAPLQLSGKRFARLLVIKRASRNSSTGRTLWECLCDCGNVLPILGAHLVNGNTQSCGCLKVERTSKRQKELRTTHGLSRTKSYRIWSTMHRRCKDPKSWKFALYGGRGISVCEHWSGQYGFEHFFADMGEKPVGTSLDRIDNNGNYEPGNCKWSTPKQQANNTRRNRKLTHNGETMGLSEWAQRFGISPSTLHQRLAAHGTDKSLSYGRVK